MARITMNDKIHLIQFLDFLCTSILMSSVPPTLLKSGATLMHLCCFMSLSAAVRMIAVKISTELINISKKQVLLKYFLIACLTLNAALFITTSVTGILINRILYVVVNQVTILCRLLINKDAKDRRTHEKPHVQMLAAALIAAATVGSFIDNKGGFYTLVIIATLISGAEIALVSQLEPEKEAKEKHLTVSAAFGVIPKTFTNAIKSISDIDIHFANWDALLIKSLLISNAKVVFILFVVMIIFVFRGNGALVCATSAYQAVAISLSGLAYNKLNRNIVMFGNSKEILEKSSIFCAACALVMGMSPSYVIYLLAFVPFIISRTFTENYFAEVFEVNKNQKLKKDIETIAAITEIVCPLFIGLLFHLFRQNAYRFLAVAPFLVIHYISKRKASAKEYKDHSEEKTKSEHVDSNKDK